MAEAFKRAIAQCSTDMGLRDVATILAGNALRMSGHRSTPSTKRRNFL